MKRNMKQWIQEMIAADVKTPMPVLSFPAVQLMGVSVRELISDAGLQAEGMRRVAERVHSAAAVSLMDLSVEAECFGAQVRVSDDEVPTVDGLHGGRRGSGRGASDSRGGHGPHGPVRRGHSPCLRDHRRPPRAGGCNRPLSRWRAA